MRNHLKGCRWKVKHDVSCTKRWSPPKKGFIEGLVLTTATKGLLTIHRWGWSPLVGEVDSNHVMFCCASLQNRNGAMVRILILLAPDSKTDAFEVTMIPKSSMTSHWPQAFLSTVFVDLDSSHSGMVLLLLSWGPISCSRSPAIACFQAQTSKKMGFLWKTLCWINLENAMKHNS